MDYRDFETTLHDSVDYAMSRAVSEGDMDSLMLRKRYACIQVSVEGIVAFAEKWDAAEDEVSKMRAAVDAALDIASTFELLAPIIASDNYDGFYGMVGNRINEIDAIVCELDKDTVKEIAEILDMPYDELMEKHWNAHVRCNDGKLELVDEED